MDLFVWIEKNHKTLAQCAEEWGMHYATLHRIATRRGKATYATALLISEKTGGKVSVKELCQAQPRARAAERAPMRAVPIEPVVVEAAPAPSKTPPKRKRPRARAEVAS